ncbi:hypothetical protein BJV74DRAFT_796411 [Russula compacta]|nr:hypothetical protein BJV74DRAFT_796411 [Russula compacta]
MTSLPSFKSKALAFDEFRNGDPKLMKWLRPVVGGLHALSTSTALSTSATLALPLAKVIFSGIGILLSPALKEVCVLQTAKYVRESYDALAEIFECIENFLRRLKVYTEIRLNPAMTEMIIKIMVELLSVLALALATKQINQGRFSRSIIDGNRSWVNFPQRDMQRNY